MSNTTIKINKHMNQIYVNGERVGNTNIVIDNDKITIDYEDRKSLKDMTEDEIRNIILMKTSAENVQVSKHEYGIIIGADNIDYGILSDLLKVDPLNINPCFRVHSSYWTYAIFFRGNV